MTDPREPSPVEPTPVPAQPVLEYASPVANAKPPPPMPGVVRFAGIYAGVLLPAACMGLSFGGFPFGPDWQSGRPGDYVKLLLSAKGGWPFFPLMAYSIVSMLLVCVGPLRFVRFFAVRMGVYAGIVLAAQFTAIMFLSMAQEGASGGYMLIGGMVGTLLPAAGLRLVEFLYGRFGAPRVSLVGVCVVGFTMLLLLGFGAEPRQVAGTVLAFPVVASLFLATPWALAAYVVVGAHVNGLANETGARPGPLAAAVPAWIVTWAGSWALAVHQAIRAYQALPTSPPSKCYVASSAAGGHRQFVRARDVGGMRVNDQLRRLKCAEIALATVAPSAHRAVRRVYDRIGPVLAEVVGQSPWLADAAYVSLKPVEWAATPVLRRIMRDFDSLAAGMYSDAGRDAKPQADLGDGAADRD